jgi:hypothetical protein
MNLEARTEPLDRAALPSVDRRTSVAGNRLVLTRR